MAMWAIHFRATRMITSQKSRRDASILEEVWRMSRPQLRDLLANGHVIDQEALAGWAYRGVALGLPKWIEALSWKTFTKVFVADGSIVRGWNIRMEQHGVRGPRKPKLKNGKDKSFGPFLVRKKASGKMAKEFPNAMLLDYGASEVSPEFSVRSLRDPLIALNRDDPTILLGCSWLQLAGASFATPSYFTLERSEPVRDESVVWHEEN
jgi:hypothetical protein